MLRGGGSWIRREFSIHVGTRWTNDKYTRHCNFVYSHVQERQKCDILSDPLLLREMAEELRRDHKQHVTKPDETTAVAGGNTQQQQELENSRENHSFQNVLK